MLPTRNIKLIYNVVSLVLEFEFAGLSRMKFFDDYTLHKCLHRHPDWNLWCSLREEHRVVDQNYRGHRAGHKHYQTFHLRRCVAFVQKLSHHRFKG